MVDAVLRWAMAEPLETLGVMCGLALVAAVPMAARLRAGLHRDHPRC